jgi:hypothetical protein
MSNQLLQEKVYLNGLKVRRKRGRDAFEVQGTEQPLTVQALCQIAERNPPNRDELLKAQQLRNRGPSYALWPPGINDQDLSKMGWAIIFPAEKPKSEIDLILEKLGNLIDLRRGQAGERYKQFWGETGIAKTDTIESYLQKFRLAPGIKRLKVFPGYLLLVGSPEEISYKLQYQLDVEYCVGRLYFENLNDFENYAQSVVSAESSTEKLIAPRAVLFGPDNLRSKATKQSAEKLILPLEEGLNGSEVVEGWRIQRIEPRNATRDTLDQLLNGALPPALLFTATHGLSFESGDDDQELYQGALVCQDWLDGGILRRKDFFAADNLNPDSNLENTFAFLFACYGAGTPKFDDFINPELGSSLEIARRPFLAALPRAMLKHGALGVVGHVDRAWTYSFKWLSEHAQPETFQFAFETLMSGKRIGTAMDYFNERYSVTATRLTGLLQYWDPESGSGIRPDPFELSLNWTAHNDARNYILLGDPAAKYPG